MFKLFKKKEVPNNNINNNNNNNVENKILTPRSNGADPIPTSTSTTNIQTSGEKKLKTKLSKCELTKSDSTTSSLANSPRSEKAELGIRDIPYDLLGKLLALIHGNRILTKEFMSTSLVCRKWRALARLNGNHINLESFFKKVEASKMRVETIESCINYFTYIYQSLETIDIGKLCINNRIYSKYSIFLIESMDKITKLSLDMSKVTLSEFEVLTSSLKSLKAIKEVTIHNMTHIYCNAMVSLFESFPELESLKFTELTFENSNEDHDLLIQYMKKNNTIQKFSITLLPDNTRFLNSIKTIMNSNRSIKNLLLSQSIKKPSLTASPSSNNVNIAPITSSNNSSAAAISTSPSSYSNSSLNSVLQTSFSIAKFNYSHDSLKELNLSNMSMNDIDMIELAENVLQNNQSLKQLDISYNKKVSSGAMEQLLRIMVRNSDMKLESLNLSGLSINDQCIGLIGDYLQTNPFLQEMYINDSVEQYWSDGFRNFSNKLSNRPALKTLYLNRNRIETKCFDDLAHTISNNSSNVRYLGLSGTLNNAQSLHLICNSLGSNTNLVSLDISNCEVCFCPSLTDSLLKNRHLAKLNVNNCKLNQKTLLGIANSNLSILDIGSNNFTSGDTLQEFFDCLKSNQSLYVLNLSNTGLKTKECQALSTLLELNSKILSVDLSNNKIKSSDIQCIVKCIQSKNLPASTKFNLKLNDTKIDLFKISNELLNNQILVD
ncbi:hypothetical protein RB653_009004 [Dictyostelium firmibasis]|uniref:F-box domain-containing protein n=1 Tax=Dictyostelium firmibasis TaxID=79012 RepID=A0AAN7U120_9MYCE